MSRATRDRCGRVTASILRLVCGPLLVGQCGPQWEEPPRHEGGTSEPRPLTQPHPPSRDVVSGGACGAAATPIAAIQGRGATSPLEGREVSVEAVVSAIFQDTLGLAGFHLQQSEADAESTSPAGLFVYQGMASRVEVRAGEVLRVQGTVTEYDGMTELSQVASIQHCGMASPPAAAPLKLARDAGAVLERYEGMLVALEQPLTLIDSYDLGARNEVLVSTRGRCFVARGSGDTCAPSLGGDLAQESLIVTDGRRESGTGSLAQLAAGESLRLGDTFEGLEGVVHQGADGYRLLLTQGVTHVARNPRPSAPPAVGGSLRIASFNVHNYFTTLGARGAGSTAELGRQRAKIAAAIAGLSADVVGLQEVENDGGAAVADLLEAVNDIVAEQQYAVVPGVGSNAGGEDSISNRILYRPGVVELVGSPSVDAAPVYRRPAIAQGFAADGFLLAVVVHHLKSRSCSGAVAAELEIVPGGGCFNALRQRQAERLLSFVEEVQKAYGSARVLVVGDFNSYPDELPISTLAEGGLRNVLRASGPPAPPYSFAYRGQVGLFDYAFATPALEVTQAAPWHINADEPRLLDYAEDSASRSFRADAFRSSDHDPILVGVRER